MDEIWVPSGYADLPDYPARLNDRRAEKEKAAVSPPPGPETLGLIADRVRAKLARLGSYEDPDTQRRLDWLEDGWYSCSQAGEDCYDDDRRGDPCDCGRDDKVRVVLRLLESVL